MSFEGVVVELAQRLKVKSSWVIDASQPTRNSDPLAGIKIGRHNRYGWNGRSLGAWLTRRGPKLKKYSMQKLHENLDDTPAVLQNRSGEGVEPTSGRNQFDSNGKILLPRDSGDPFRPRQESTYVSYDKRFQTEIDRAAES